MYMEVVHKKNEWMHSILSFMWQQILEFLLLFIFLSCNLHKFHFELKLKISISHELLHILKIVEDFEGWDVQTVCATTS